MTPQLIGVIGFGVLFVLILLRIPVGIAMGIVGVVGYSSLDGWDRALRVLGQSPFDVASGYTLSVVPLFVLMGDLALRSGMTRKLYRSARAFFFGTRGALALATIGACAGFSAICGSSLATAATMTRIAVPEMRQAGYRDELSTGSVAAGGTLGILIPPSIPLVIYALIAEQSVPRLFAAGLIPGIVLMLLYMTTIIAIVRISPHMAPAAPPAGESGSRIRDLFASWNIALLFAVTIGGLYSGFFTPTEAAAVGAAGALTIGVCSRTLDFQGVVDSFLETVRTTCILFLIVICAVQFSYFVVQAQLPVALGNLADAWQIESYFLIAVLVIFYLILGCFMDGLGLILITVPIFLPIVVTQGYDPIWFGIFLVVVIEMGLMTPPVGMNVFVIQAQLPDLSLIRIYRGIVPFLLSPLLLVVAITVAPGFAIWLPTLLFP